MRGYYYDQTGEAPRSTPAPIFAGRRRRWSGAAAVLLFLLTMALLGGLTAAAGLWSHSRLEELPALADSTWQPLPVREELPEETTVERAPTGDGTTLTISPLPSGGAHSLQEIYRENIASIVSIRGSKGDGMSLGTGVVMSEDGYIITNSHVIEGCGAVDVVLQDERVFQALLVGQDAQSDLAVLKIDCAGLTPAQFGDSTLLEVGDAVAAIGNPLGEELRGTMTDGIISAINRDVNVDGYTMVLLQTTAALNSGNSGGALINDRGQVVGITNLKMRAYDNTVEGLGFAIPISDVRSIITDIMENGAVTDKAYMAITAGTMNEQMAAQFNIDVTEGVFVYSVVEGGAGDKAGLRLGDVITKMGDKTLTSRQDLSAAMKGYRAGDTVTLTVYRGGQYIEVELTFDTQPQTTGSDDSSQSSDNSYGYGNGGNSYGGQMPDNWQEFYNYFFGNRG